MNSKTDRIEKLRNQSLQAIPELSIERARLLTEFYKTGADQKYSAPVHRAMAFKYILENKIICINPGELIIGERGPGPALTPTYPEVCCHSLEDLKILNTRKKIPFKINDETYKLSKEYIIPFWSGRSLRDKIFLELDQDWKDAYDAGIFTEFMEQRAPGHTCGGESLWKKGMLNYQEEIDNSIKKLNHSNDKLALEKREELKAMKIASEAIIIFAKRHAVLAHKLANKESDATRKEELLRIAEICEYVPAYAPRDIWESLQHYWFIHLGVITEYNTWDAFNPGRLDQHLLPFYNKLTTDSSIRKDFAEELLQAFWIKFNNQPSPPKVGITAEESATYTDFCNINIGGLKKDGSDAVNEVSYLLLDTIENMRILQPSSNVQISEKTPDKFLKRALEIVKTGFGQPSVFNTDAIIEELTRQGKKLVDARNGGASGCVEAGAFGTEAYILTGYFNMVKILEITLNNGVDPRTGKLIGLHTGDPTEFKSFAELFNAFSEQFRFFVDIKVKGNLIIEKMWSEYLPCPFLSLLIDDCIENGKDYNSGGARYNTSYIQMVGIGSLVDSLTALKYHVYEHKTIQMEEFLRHLKENFEHGEKLKRDLIFKTPKYGNDDDYTDELLPQIFLLAHSSVDGRANIRGGQYHINFLPTTVHVYFGKVTGATPDGRSAFTPLSEGISPVQGVDIKGPTAVLKSASKLDHLNTGGTLLNQKFSPNLLEDEKGIESLVHLIRTYFSMGGHHIQFNIVDAKILHSAQKHPESYRDLVVRVAGYSDYFINLGKDLQDEIIKRTEHSGF